MPCGWSTACTLPPGLWAGGLCLRGWMADGCSHKTWMMKDALHGLSSCCSCSQPSSLQHKNQTPCSSCQMLSESEQCQSWVSYELRFDAAAAAGLQ